jgi:hypothetical protein
VRRPAERVHRLLGQLAAAVGGDPGHGQLLGRRRGTLRRRGRAGSGRCGVTGAWRRRATDQRVGGHRLVAVGPASVLRRVAVRAVRGPRLLRRLSERLAGWLAGWLAWWLARGRRVPLRGLAPGRRVRTERWLPGRPLRGHRVVLVVDRLRRLARRGRWRGALAATRAPARSPATGLIGPASRVRADHLPILPQPASGSRLLRAHVTS